MFVSSIGQKALPAISRQLTQPLKHIPKNQPSLLIRYTHSEHNKVALATQEQLHKVQLGLNDKISSVETRLSEKISALDTKFTKEIAGVETRLTEKFTKEIAGVETRLTEKIAKSHTELSDKIANNQTVLLTAMEKQNTALLTAIEKQNTGNERFKKRVYTMLGGFAATFIGYANRDRLFTMLASLKPEPVISVILRVVAESTHFAQQS